MESTEIGKEEDETKDQTELEKLVEQKQQETEALKRLIQVLGKIDLNTKDHTHENE